MAGIVVKGGGKVIATNATIKGNAGGGVIAEDGGYVDIDNADVSDNEGHGVAVDNAEVSAKNAKIESNGVEVIYNELGIREDKISVDQLEFLIDKAIENQKSSNLVDDLMAIVGNSVIFSSLATSDPLIAAVSIVAACGIDALQRFKRIIVDSK